MTLWHTEAEHALYLSPIKAQVDSSGLRGEFNVFEDDLRDALRSHSQLSSHDWVLLVPHLESYYKQHFVLTVAHQQIPISFHIVERTPDVVIMGFTSERIDLDQEIMLKADYLIELFPTQKNILTLTIVANQKKGVKHLIFERNDAKKIVSLEL